MLTQKYFPTLICIFDENEHQSTECFYTYSHSGIIFRTYTVQAELATWLMAVKPWC